MDGNDAAFSPTPSEGKQWVLDKPKILLFETNWHEDSHEKFVALKLQDEVPISAAISLQKGSEFLHLFNYNLKKLLERGIIFKLNGDWSKKKVVDFEAPPAMSLGYDNLLFPFVIIIGGATIAVFVIVCEVVKSFSANGKFKRDPPKSVQSDQQEQRQGANISKSQIFNLIWQ